MSQQTTEKQRKRTPHEVATVAARQALTSIWENALLRGRCTGPVRNGKNPFAGSNITFNKDGILITVTADRKGQISVHEFVPAETPTPLGDEVRRILQEKGLNVKPF